MSSFLLLGSILFKALLICCEPGLIMIVVADQSDHFISSITVERDEQIGIVLQKARNLLMSEHKYSSMADFQFNYDGYQIQQLREYRNEFTTLATLNINPFDDFCKIEVIPIRNNYLTYHRQGSVKPYLRVKMHILDELEIRFKMQIWEIGDVGFPLISTDFFTLNVVPDLIARHQIYMLIIDDSPQIAQLQFKLDSKYISQTMPKFRITAPMHSYVDFYMKLTNNYVEIKMDEIEQRMCHDFSHFHGLSNVSISTKSINRLTFLGTFGNARYHLRLRDVFIQSTEGPKFNVHNYNRTCLMM